MKGGMEETRMGAAPTQVREHLYDVNWTRMKKTLCVLTVQRQRNTGMAI